MSVFGNLLDWVKGPLVVQGEEHKKMREAVHASRNLAQIAVHEAFKSERSSNRICEVAQQVIKRLEGSNECKD